MWYPNKVSDRDRAIVLGRDVYGMTWRELADRHRLTRNRVVEIYRNTTDKLTRLDSDGTFLSTLAVNGLRHAGLDVWGFPEDRPIVQTWLRETDRADVLRVRNIGVKTANEIERWAKKR